MRGWLGGHRQRDGLTTRTNYSRCRPIPARRHQQPMAIRFNKMHSNLFLMNLSSLSENPASKEALGNKALKRSLRSDLFLMNVLGAD